MGTADGESDSPTPWHPRINSPTFEPVSASPYLLVDDSLSFPFLSRFSSTVSSHDGIIKFLAGHTYVHMCESLDSGVEGLKDDS